MTMSRLTALILLGLATALAFCLLPAAATEPNDASTNATAITPGLWGPFDIDPIGDQDWYTFSLAEPASVHLAVNGSSGNPDMYLYDANVSYLDYNSYGNSYPWPEIDDFLQAGSYFVVIADEYGYYNFTGYYLTLEVYFPQPLIEGIQGPYNVNYTHTQDWYSFGVVETSTVRVELSGSSGDSEMYLYNATNQAYIDYDDDGGYGLWSLFTNQLGPGIYYLMVQSHSGGSVVDYYVNLTRTSLAGPDGNGIRDNATLVTLGMNGPFDIDPVGDVDWYVITFAGPGIATFETNGSSGSTYLALYNENGTWLGQDWSSGYGSFSWMAATVEARTYYIYIEGQSSVIFYNYSLEIMLQTLPPADNNDDRDSASGTHEGVNGPFSLVTGDADWYGFVASVPGTLRAETNGPKGGGASVTIYDEQSNVVAYGSNTGNFSYQRASALVDRGTYYIQVMLPYGILAVLEYNLTITFTPWTSPDGNDFRSTAQQIVPGLNGPYSIDPYADADWYYFFQETSGTARVQIYGGTGYGTIELYNDTGTFWSGGTYGVQQVQMTLAPGRWLVRLSSAYGSYQVPEYYLNLTVVDNSDPPIVMSGPTNGTQVDAGAVQVSGRTEPGSQVWVGSQEVFVDINGSFRAMVPVVLGQNAITVTSVDRSGNSAVTVVTVVGITHQQALEDQLNTANANLAAAQAALATAQGDLTVKTAAVAAAQAEVNALQAQLATQNGTLAAAQTEAGAARGASMMGYLLAGLGFAAAVMVAVLLLRRKPPMATQVLSPVAPAPAAAPVVVSVPASPPPAAPPTAPAPVAETPKAADAAPTMLPPTPIVGSFTGPATPQSGETPK